MILKGDLKREIPKELTQDASSASCNPAELGEYIGAAPFPMWGKPL